MALLVRIYFNAVFGALGGLIGWMLFGVFGNARTTSDFGQWLLGGGLIGGAIGYLVVSVDAVRDLSLPRFCRLASYGVCLGALGGALGMCIGEWVNILFVRHLMGPAGEGFSTRHLIGFMLGRALGWMFLGIAIGISEGIAARSLGRMSYSTLGGAIGGFVGGALFGLFYYLLVIQRERADQGAGGYFWAALGLVILGACIGSLSALVQAVLQPASIKVLRGWQEGREYPVLKPETLLGREEHADIALFRDMNVEKRHALIRRDHNRFLLVNNHAPAEQTLVNDRPVAQACELHDGDRVQLGKILLRFQMREAQPRKKVVHERSVVAARSR
jgi:MFS family permease